ncbi:MAG: hypothetical protein AAGJ46_02640 [Planctomycetota bacterium]
MGRPFFVGAIQMLTPLRHRLMVAFAISALFAASQAWGEASPKIALPSHAVFGKPLGATLALPKASEAAPLIYPESIHFDLQEGAIVYGLIATYPDAVGFDALVETMNVTQRKWWGNEDGTAKAFGVNWWRNEDDRFTTQVSDSRVVMIWLDRKVSDREQDALVGAFLRAAKEAAAASQAEQRARKSESKQ